MPISDKKKVQSLINRAAEAARDIRGSVADLKALRATFQSAGPDTKGTPLDGGAGVALSNAIDAIDAEISKPVWASTISARVPTHRGKALD